MTALRTIILDTLRDAAPGLGIGIKEAIASRIVRGYFGAQESWTPTVANINALPDPVRAFVTALETQADPSGMVRDNFQLRAENAGLRRECETLAEMGNLEGI